MMQYPRSTRAFHQSQGYLSGGVSSLMRASAKPTPLFFRSASGAVVTDFDGRRYVDYVMGWGPLILGHSHPAIVRAVREQLERFQLLGAQHELEIEVARKLCKLVPSAELVAFSNTGTEAVQLALRLARAYTGRQKFIKFEGHYHGWADNVLLNYHPTNHSTGRMKVVPSSEGQCRSSFKDVIILPWNDLDALASTIATNGREIAAIITEPILCNSSCLLPSSGYMEGMRRLTKRHNIVLIFDEVITGFRAGLGGAQGRLGIRPDLTILGKALGAGFPVSAVAGCRKILQLIAQKRVVHAGTFNGNPISLSAANAALRVLSAGGGRALKQIDDHGRKLKAGIARLAAQARIPVLINGIGPVFQLSFTTRRSMRNYRDTLDCNLDLRDKFIQAMLENGIYLLPDCRWYPSAVHTKAHLSKVLQAVAKAFGQLQA